MGKKRSNSIERLNLFGLGLNYAYYVNDFLPEHEPWIKDIYKKIGYNWKFKFTIKEKSEYWDCSRLYPKNTVDFKDKFFSKKNPKEIEGIWQLDRMNKPGFIGIVQNKDIYEMYYIDINWKFKQHTGSMFKNVFNHPGESDYSILSGTKFGVLIPSETNHKEFKFKGILTTLSSIRKEEQYPLNSEVEFDFYLASDHELRNESEVAKKLEEYSLGQTGRSCFKVWPEFAAQRTYVTEKEREIIRKARESRNKNEGKNQPGFSNSKIHNNEKSKDESKENTRPGVGSGFFVSDTGLIVTNFHVVEESNNIKVQYDGNEIQAKVLATDRRLDLALIKIDKKNKNFVKFSNKSPFKSQEILVAGFPFGKAISDDLKITGGIINSLKGVGNDTTRMQIDASVHPGNSGGPIVDKSTKTLIGVAVASLDKDFTKAAFGVASENTNYAIKASQVRDFLESNNIEVKNSKSKDKISSIENSTVFIIRY